MTAETINWRGAEELEKLLVPVASLECHPGNPRRGAVEQIAESIERFGQVRPVLVDDSGYIIAGNHTFMAITSLGWSHVAALPNKFADAAEARAYLLADNRLSDLGAYDQRQLQMLLEEIESVDGWLGTGYGPDDLEDLRALQDAIPETDAVPFAGDFALTPEELEERAARLGGGQSMNELVLVLDAAQSEQFDLDLRVLRKEYDNAGVTDAVVRAVASAAQRVHQA
jgi:ParB-like chromosome segregation protein Spo0J